MAQTLRDILDALSDEEDGDEEDEDDDDSTEDGDP